MNQQTVNAIYQNGVLRPISSIDLPENSEVELDIKVIENKHESRKTIDDLLVRKGLSLGRKLVKPKQNLSNKERERLAKAFSGAEPLGEIISKDREERF